MMSESEANRVGQLVDIETAHIIRSHRAPSDQHAKRWFSGFLVLVMSVTLLPGVTHNAVAHAGTPTTAAPARHGLAVAADSPSDLLTTALPNPEPPQGSTAAVERASRSDVRPPAIEVVIAFALAQRGKPYRLGTAGPRTYDCSGLVMAAFATIGLKLPHYTGSIIHYGMRVSRVDMRRGDVVFLSSHHVAIYLGNGLMIVAPHTGTVVKIQKVYAFYAARRMIG